MKQQNEANIKKEKYYLKQHLYIKDFLEISIIVSKTTKKQYVQKKYKFIDKNAMLQDNQKFVSEIKAMKMINSPFVVNLKEIYATTIPEFSLNIIMEYVEGNNLEQEIEEGKHFSFEQITDWIIYICLGLHEIHSHNIIHRDLKPANIFLTKDKKAKIGDFDVSKLLKCKNETASSVIGTLNYSSPEKMRGKQYYTDDDMWSLGIIIYKLISLEHPFKSDFNKMINGNYTPLNENVKNELKELVDNLLKVDGKDRPSAIEVLHMDFIKKRIKILLDTKQITKENIPPELYANVMTVIDYSKALIEKINTPKRMDEQHINKNQNLKYSESFQILNIDRNSSLGTITHEVTIPNCSEHKKESFSKGSELFINEFIYNQMSKTQAETYREISHNLIRNIGNEGFNNLLNLSKNVDNYSLYNFKENIKLCLQIDNKSTSEIDITLKQIDDIYSMLKSIC